VADLGRQAPVPVLRQDHEHGGAVRGLTTTAWRRPSADGQPAPTGPGGPVG
jgi:hypothetical protein